MNTPATRPPAAPADSGPTSTSPLQRRKSATSPVRPSLEPLSSSQNFESVDLDAAPPPPTPAQRTGSEYNDDLVHLVESIDIFREAARVERLLLATIWGRILFIGFAIASPVDLALDIRLGVLLATYGSGTWLPVHESNCRGASPPLLNLASTPSTRFAHRWLLPCLMFVFLYLGLRLQVLLLLSTSDTAALLSRRRRTSVVVTRCDTCLQCLFSWQLPLTEFSLRRVAIAWAPFGLQCAGDKRYVLRSMALEILYAPLVLLLGSGLVLYGALHIAKDMVCHDAESDFWRLNSDGQVRRVRATLISIVATSVTAVPQIFLQSYAYASAAVPLTPAGERLVIASISFSLLSLLRSICGLLASWRKIRFTFQRVNGNLEAEVFNACLHECADAAERTGDRCSFKFKDGDSSDLVMLQELRLVMGQNRGGTEDLAFQLAPEAVTRSNLSFGDLEESPPPLPPRSPERPSTRNVTPEPPQIALV